jgi:hypothetical protein
VGTKAEMEKFQAAFKEVMQAKPARIVTPRSRDLWATLDGPRVPLKLAPDT